MSSKSKKWATASITAVVAGAALSIAPASVHAATLYFGQTSVQQGGSTSYAKGSWSISQSNGTRYYVAGQTRKSSSGGNSAYWRATLQASSGICLTGISTSQGGVSVSCHLDYHNYKTIEGTRFNSSYWNSSSRYEPVQSNSKTASAGMRACVDVRFAIDPCSAPSWTNGIQYRN